MIDDDLLNSVIKVDLFDGQDGIPGGPYDVVVATLAIHIPHTCQA